MSDHPIKRLTITGCKKVYTGKNKKNQEYNIYEIQATNDAGVPVQQTLKCFDELKIGLTDDFEVEKYDGGQHGISYTLKRMRPKLGPRVEHLEDVVIPALLARIMTLERAAGIAPQQTTGAERRQEAAAAAPPPEQPPPQEPPPQQQQAASIGGGANIGAQDDDIPF